jgi:glycosyltransferase involved in cell wall biosynthesis
MNERSKKRIAWLSPLPPQKSGISDYSFVLTSELKNYFEIDLYQDLDSFNDNSEVDSRVLPLSTFAAQRQSYDAVIYHLGNNCEFHENIYKLAWRCSGIIVLHDYNINPFMYESFYKGGQNKDLYEQALIEGYGEAGRRELEALTKSSAPSLNKFPMSHAIVKRSRKTIVHHRWVKHQFGEGNQIEVIPPLTKINYLPTTEDVAAFKSKYGIDEKHFVVSCLGFINQNKLPQLQVEVVRKLIAGGYPVKMIFAGEVSPDVQSFAQEIRAGEYAKEIIFTGYQTEADYWTAIFASDIVINLRNPSMGEASATLMHSLAAGKPTIISDLNQYREFPDTVCWKLPHDENQGEVLTKYIATLLSDKNLRATISKNSQDYIAGALSWERTIERWRRIISH